MIRYALLFYNIEDRTNKGVSKLLTGTVHAFNQRHLSDLCTLIMTCTQYHFCVIQLRLESNRPAIITLKHHCLEIEKAADCLAWHHLVLQVTSLFEDQ